METNNKITNKYNLSIDTLKVLSTIVIIIYNLDIEILGYKILKGGYLAVDIFFFLTGFLITNKVFKNLDNPNFYLIDYIKTKLSKIFFKIIIVIFFVIPLTWFLLLPDNFLDFSYSILSSISMISNIYFHYSGNHYGIFETTLKPLMHIWSISLTQQFILFYPFFLFLILSFFKKISLNLLIIIFLFSLFFSNWASYTHPSFNFYMPPSRIWEFLLGGLLSIFILREYLNIRNSKINILFILLGYLFLFTSLFFFDELWFHPSFYTLIPITGVLLIIFYNQNNFFLNKILNYSFFKTIRKCYFFLFIWHFPLISLLKLLELNYFLFKVLLLIIVFILSVYSQKIFEKLNLIEFNDKKIFYFVMTPFVILLFVSVSLIKNNDNLLKFRLDKKFQERLSDGGILSDSTGRCDNRIKEWCNFNKTGKKKVFILGDSHPEAFMRDLKKRLIQSNYEFTTMTYGACIYLKEFSRVKIKRNNIIDSGCDKTYQKEIREKLLQNKNSIVIYTGRFSLYTTGEYFDNLEGGKEENYKWNYRFKNDDNISIEDGIKETINELLENQNYVILLYPIPEVGWHVPRKLLAQTISNKIFKRNYDIEKEDSLLTTNYEVYKKRHYKIFKVLDGLEHKNLFRLYPHKIFCNSVVKNRCITTLEDKILYSDDEHVSTYGAQMINHLILTKINEIEVISKK